MSTTLPELRLSTFTLPHLPIDSHYVHIAVLKNIRNAEHVRNQLLVGNADYEYAFIDANSIISTTHVLTAAFKSLRGVLGSPDDPRGGGLRTRNIHAEIVFSLSPNNNITESFTRFGITSKTRSLIVVKIEILQPPSAVNPTTGLNKSAVHAFLTQNVEFEGSLGFTDETLYGLCDLELVRERYKFVDRTKGVGIKGGGKKGSAGKKSAGGGVVDTCSVEVRKDVEKAVGEKKEWSQGGRDVQKEVEVGVIGAMVLRVVG